jgi:hypothetical protein
VDHFEVTLYQAGVLTIRKHSRQNLNLIKQSRPSLMTSGRPLSARLTAETALRRGGWPLFAGAPHDRIQENADARWLQSL